MVEIIIDLGTRLIQYTNGSNFVNIPIVAVRSLSLEAGMPVHLYLKGRTLMIELPEGNAREYAHPDESRSCIKSC